MDAVTITSEALLPVHVGEVSDIEVKQLRYVLYALVVHKGISVDFGHYVCVGRNAWSKSNEWTVFDDTNTFTYNSLEDALNSFSKDGDTPYMLFYASETIIEKYHQSSNVFRLSYIINSITSLIGIL
jgi:ubiquitin C-terminal hydrolase